LAYKPIGEGWDCEQARYREGLDAKLGRGKREGRGKGRPRILFGVWALFFPSPQRMNAAGVPDTRWNFTLGGKYFS